MERISQRFTRGRALSLAAGALTLGVALLAGCGGSSQSVISTGFPANGGANSITTPSSSGSGTLTLTASNLSSPLLFKAPTGAPTPASVQSSSGGSLTAVPGTAYQTPMGVQFSGPVTMKIVYTLPKGTDPQTLNIYYYDGKVWQPVTPTSGGFSSTAGTITTTISSFQGTGLYAVLSSAPPSTP